MGDIFDKCYAFDGGINAAKAAGIYPYFKAISKLNGPHCTVNGREMIMLGSNNYLGLTTHPKVRQAATQALEQYGTSCSGSRFLNGTLDLHEQLEEELAEFMSREAVQVFSTGFTTNQGIIAPLVGRDDTVIIDRLVHASIIDAVRLGFGKVRRFRHNDPESLRRNLEVSQDSRGVLVVVDGVYSMDGDIAPLREIAAASKEYGARLMVDDAHGLGVLGKSGRGVLEHFDLFDQVDLVMGTFSKSFASLGGFVAGDEQVISYIKHNSRALIFQAAMPPSAVAAVLAALDVMRTEPEHRERLWENTHFLLESFKALGFDTGATQTPIIPIIIGEDIPTAIFWKRLFDEGVFTNCVVAPAVPPGAQRLRTSLMATHSRTDLEVVIEVCGRVGKELGLIK